MHNVAKNKHHVGEEVANAVTHGLGALAAVVALVLMLIKATPVLSGVNFAAVAIYQDCRKTSPLQGEDVRQWHESPPSRGLPSATHRVRP